GNDGELRSRAAAARASAQARRERAAPTVRHRAFPELLDDEVPDDNRLSCSVRMSLAAQGLFINDVVVRFASQLLYELFARGWIAQHGVLINLDSKRSGPIEVDPLAWRRFGYEAIGGDESEESSAVVG